ncbi:MAG: hypothetical protein ACTHJT_02265 [Cytophaga sp.]|uniref:hypothetical protein n=1 Tax=Cytophaga sp. TaxID=29535 RepID=UPI003F80E836
MKYLSFALIVFCLNIQSAFAQDSTAAVKKKKMHGTFYVTWGYQKDYYTRSDVHFKNDRDDNYDFTLHNVKAHDQRDMNDFFSQPLTVPQYVFYGGYFFNNKGDWGIEAGWDHLKYIVTEGQTAHMTGQIHGVQYDQDTIVNYNFWHYEHTNGNNYLTASLLKRFTFFKSEKSHHKLSLIAKAGGGFLIPKTQSVIMGNERDGPFRLAGYVFTLGGAVRYDIYRYFFLEASMKGAYAHYTHDKIYGEGIANQHFFSQQFILSAGFNIPLSKD